MQLQRFDRDVTLGELLQAMPAHKVSIALTRSLGMDWRLFGDDGAVLLAPAERTAALTAEASVCDLRLDIELLGRLAADRPREQVEAAAAWLELVLRGTHRYRMASDLHMAAVHADYEALQRKHLALQESEARYRELSTQLEHRVALQVQTIERAQRQLYQSEKMAAVGSLAAGMAHEINNPIGFIRSNLATARGYVQKVGATLAAFRQGDAAAAEQAWKKADMDFVLEDFSGLLDESVSGADRVARIIANLKAYASIDCDSSQPADLNESVRTVLGMVRDQCPATVTFDTDLQPLPAYTCDQSRMHQMLFALVQNARQAVGAAGTVRVSTCIEHGEIRIRVRDDGRGIAPETLTRIFDPFFTTHDVGKGMGLGLTVSRDIASAHGGRIEVESVPGAGSTFLVCLPLAGTFVPGRTGESVP